MSIFKNLKKAHAAVAVDLANNDNPTLGKQFSDLAVAAVTKGLESPEWKKYMSLFADNAEQLERLTVQADGEEKYLRLFRAYIVANSICDITTQTDTINKIDETIDAGIVNQASDGTIERPLELPEV
jgi:hypothetical protein